MTKKIGRNDLCHCKSGRKYKKCCLNKERELKVQKTIPPNIYQFIILKYFSEKHIEIDAERKLLEKELINELSQTEQNSSRLLSSYLENCESLIQKIASNYTTYEMLFWSRRLGPKNIFNVSELSVMLYRETQSLCIYKYGKDDDNIYIDERDSVFPKHMECYNKLEYIACIDKIKGESLPTEISNLLSDIIRIEILSFLFIKGTQHYRIANKGGILNIDHSTNKITTSTNADLDYLINLYDERLSNANLFSMIGSFVNAIDKKLEEPYFCPHFQLNVDHKTRVKLFTPKNETYKSFVADTIEAEFNYILGAISLKNIYEFLKLFTTEFEQYYSFTLKDFIVFLGYLGYKIVSNISESIDAQFHIFNRAYTITPSNLELFKEDFEKSYIELHRIIFNENVELKIDIMTILNTFLLKNNNKLDIDIWTRGPKRFFYQLSESHTVIDYYCMTDIISYIVKEITNKDGEVGNRRATYFERMLENEIKNCYGIENVWLCSKEITSNKLKKEIDGSFVIDNFLFIIEAKAINVSFGFDKGDIKALEFRKNKMISALKESNEKAEFIKAHKNTLDIKLPDNIEYICPFVISTNPEYIWERNEMLFINETLPRILTLEDLKLIKNINLNQLSKKDWVLKI